MKENKKKVVCLGGGIGTVNLIRGLKKYPVDLTVVVSMADDGGSSGRLRRLYDVFPPGDVVSCLSALSNDPELSRLLTYRFAGDRYGKDIELGGHKLGNLILTALSDMQPQFIQAIRQLQQLFHISGEVLPATQNAVTISAKTIQNRFIYGEEKIDLGKYQGKRILESVFLHPEESSAGKEVIEAIKQADAIILGPGDLYTALLPVVIVKNIAKALIASTAQKIFVVNVANKPFETRGYTISDYISAIQRHLGVFPFQKVIVNNNHKEIIPKKYHYKYVSKKKAENFTNIQVEEADIISHDFPLYHDSDKLAKVLWQHI